VLHTIPLLAATCLTGFTLLQLLFQALSQARERRQGDSGSARLR
jgi:hypothetical protein